MAGVEWTLMKLLRGLSLIWLFIDGVELSLPLKDGPAAEWNEIRHAEFGRLRPPGVSPVLVYDVEGLFGALIRQTICTFE